MGRASELAPPVSMEGVALGCELGRGTSAHVFAGSLGGADVALKIAHERAEAPRLAREARILLRGGRAPIAIGWARIDGARLVVSDIQDASARPVLVLERVDGAPLGAGT